MQFCPICLNTDVIPYFRKIWRIAIHAVCPLHECRLEECCPSCLSPVSYHRHGVGREREIFKFTISLCNKCGFDLRLTNPKKFYWDDRKSSDKLYEIIVACNGGHWNCGSYTPASSVPFFRGVHHLLSLINGRNGYRIYSHLESAVSVSIEFTKQEKESQFEFLCINERLYLLMMVAWLLADWPTRFIEICHTGKLSRSYVNEDVNSLPFWLADVVNEYLDIRPYFFSNTEIGDAVAYLSKNNAKVTVRGLMRLLGIGRDGAKIAWEKWKLQKINPK